MPEPKPLRRCGATFVRAGNAKLSFFAGCDYFRLSGHPALSRAAKAAVDRFGMSVTASRLTTGNHGLYTELEHRLATFFGSETAVLTGSGYSAAQVAAQAMAGHFSHALVDSRAHPALLDAARFLECPIFTFKTQDPADLARTAQRCGRQSRLLVLTDGLFAHDGSVAPLKKYLGALPRRTRFLVDDSHAVGILGRNGRGTLEHQGISRTAIVQTASLGKAFGGHGGAILCDLSLRGSIFTRSRAFIGSTPPALPVAAALLAAVRHLEKHGRNLRARLLGNTSYARRRLEVSGVPTMETPGPIVALAPLSRRKTKEIEEALMKAGVYPPLIRYPGAPREGYYRFVVSSEHTREQIDRWTAVVAACHPAAGRPLNRPAT